MIKSTETGQEVGGHRGFVRWIPGNWDGRARGGGRTNQVLEKQPRSQSLSSANRGESVAPLGRRRMLADWPSNSFTTSSNRDLSHA